MVSLEIIGLIFTGLSISISIIYYASVLRNQNKTRQAQFFKQFSDRLHEPKTLSLWVQMTRWEWEDFEDFERKYGSIDHPDQFGERYSFWAMLNDLGWLVEKGIIGIGDVDTLIGPMIYWTWEKFEPVIVESRRVYHYPDQYRSWETLTQKVIEYRKKQNTYRDIPEYYDDYLSSIEQ